MSKKTYILVIFSILCGTILAAPSFTAQTSRTTVATGQTFQIKFTLNASGSNFTPPDLSNFAVLSGPNQSSSMSWMNGKTSQTLSYSYYLSPTKVGTFTIEPATIVVDGNKISSNPLKITVVKGAAVANRQQNNNQQSNTQGASPSTAVPIGDNNKDIFIRVSVNKTHVYQGQPIIASYKLYTDVNITDNSMGSLPNLNGFWSKDLLDPKSGVTWQTTYLNGRRYNVAELKRVLLFPLHSGDLTIDPWSMDFTIRKAVRNRSNNIFNMFFGSYKNVKVKVKSNAIAIHVKPLPSKRKPDNFNGVVGNYKLSVKLDKDSVKANNAINLTVKISGSGNLKLINIPNLQFPKGFEVYDPDITDHFVANNGTLVGSREFKYLIIPRYPGKYTLDTMKLSYFNPETKQYHTITGTPLKINVAKGSGKGGLTTFSSTQKQDIANLGSDIRYLKPTANLEQGNSVLWNTPTFYALGGAPILLFLIALAYKKKEEKDQSNFGKMQNRQANKMANKYLKDARRQLKVNNKTAFYEAVLNALNNYLAYKLNIDRGSITKDMINERLTERKIDEVHISKLNQIMEECEMAQYAPIESKSNETVLNDAARIIGDIEKNIHRG